MIYYYIFTYTLYISIFIRINAIESLKDLKYEDLEKQLINLQGSFAKMYKAKDLFSDYIKSSYEKNSKGDTVECSPSIGILTHLSSIENDIERPQVVISGEIHGDERIGVSSVLFASKLLIWSSQCVIESITESCNQLNDRKISLEMRNWLAFLNSRRETYIIPAANCMGYILHKRKDGNIDANRDFSYQRHDTNCMQSNTAKIFYYLMNNLASQIVVTFHGGMVALGYEWGSLNHKKPHDKSPDHASHASIGKIMEIFAGPTTTSTTSNSFYHAEPINSNIYSVAGGMEDWIYAAGWDKSGLKKCKNLKEINIGEPRSLVFLVETANAKHPSDISLGNELDPFFQSLQSLQSQQSQPTVVINQEEKNRRLLLQKKPQSSIQSARRPPPKSNSNGNSNDNSNGNIRRHNHVHNGGDAPTIGSLGHVPRNARLILAAIDMAQPYVCLKELNTNTNTQYLQSLSWYVGGSIDIHSTFVSLYNPPNNNDELLRKASQGEWTSILESLQPPSKISPQLKSKRNLFRSLTKQRAYSSILFSKNKNKSKYSDNRNLKKVEEIGAGHEVWRLSDVQRGRGRWFPSEGNTTTATASNSYSSSSSVTSLHVKKGLQSSVLAFEQSSSSIQIFHHNISSSSLLTGTTTTSPSLVQPKEGDYWLILWARVDPQWGRRGQGYPSELGPQAHASRARTDPYFKYEQPSNKWRSKRIIKGRMYWPSDPIPIKLEADGQIIIRSHVLNCAWWNRK